MPIQNPKINIISHSFDNTQEPCRCVSIETVTSDGHVLSMEFDSIDDAKAYYGLLGYALGVTS